jgi:hypothetical protein
MESKKAMLRAENWGTALENLSISYRFLTDFLPKRPNLKKLVGIKSGLKGKKRGIFGNSLQESYKKKHKLKY